MKITKINIAREACKALKGREAKCSRYTLLRLLADELGLEGELKKR